MKPNSGKLTWSATFWSAHAWFVPQRLPLTKWECLWWEFWGGGALIRQHPCCLPGSREGEIDALPETMLLVTDSDYSIRLVPSLPPKSKKTFPIPAYICRKTNVRCKHGQPLFMDSLLPEWAPHNNHQLKSRGGLPREGCTKGTEACWDTATQTPHIWGVQNWSDRRREAGREGGGRNIFSAQVNLLVFDAMWWQLLFSTIIISLKVFVILLKTAGF